MPELKELNPTDHGDLKVAPDCALKVAKNQHLINLKVSEIGHAMTSFPVFMTKVREGTDWAISAITSFELDNNLFVKDNEWQAAYTPAGMQTYPFFLMNSPKGEGQFTIGIDEENEAFSKDSGEALFEDNEKASIYLSQITAQLEGDINNEVHTFHFTRMLDELGLLKQMDLQVHYQDRSINTLKGLHTVDEEKLQNMDIESIETLRSKGYLGPTYAMLMSIYQLNAMIRRHNNYGDLRSIAQVKLEVPKDQAAA